MTCDHCGTDSGQLRCSRCKQATYCGRDCQRAAWRTHRPQCGRPRAAVSADLFPAALRHFAFQPSADGRDHNLLVLLHGLGDSEAPYSRLARAMALPKTASLALRGPLPVPLTPDGFAWMLSFDEAGERISGHSEPRIRSARRTRELVLRLIDALAAAGLFARRRIHLLGFSQGGAVALDVAAHCCGAGMRLGSAVGVCAATPTGLGVDEGACHGDCTPTLLLAGERDDVVAPARVQATAERLREAHRLDGARVHVEPGKGHSMLGSSEAEMRVVMEFLAAHLEQPSALESREDFVRVA